MQKTYSRIIWENYPSTETPVNETNLNKIDAAVDTIDDRVIVLDTTKANQSDLLQTVKSIAFNQSTGVFTITYSNGTTSTIDTDIEKVAVNFDYDDDPTSAHYQSLVITLDDGTVKYIDLSALITQYEFSDTVTIHFSIGNDGSISANVIDGSITEAKLQPNFLADCRSQVSQAESYATSAGNSASTATTQATNAANSASTASTKASEAATSATNASNSATAASSSADTASTKATQASTSATNAANSATNAATSATNAGTSETNAAASATTASNKATEAGTSATNASNSALKSEGYAVGEQNGTPVSSGDYYQNNSKYFAQRASDIVAQLLEAYGVSVSGTKLIFSSAFEQDFQIAVVGTQLQISSNL